MVLDEYIIRMLHLRVYCECFDDFICIKLCGLSRKAFEFICYLIVVLLMRKPCRYMAAVCHAFVLFNFLCGILSEVGIGEFGEEVADEVAVDGFAGIDVFRCHAHSSS